MPTSWEMVAAISSVRAARPSEMRFKNLARSSRAVADQAGNAAAAACTARSTSSAVPRGWCDDLFARRIDHVECARPLEATTGR